jgi:hypothetical protein
VAGYLADAYHSNVLGLSSDPYKDPPNKNERNF